MESWSMYFFPILFFFFKETYSSLGDRCSVPECGTVPMPGPWWAASRDLMTELRTCDFGPLAFRSHVYKGPGCQGLCFYLQGGGGVCVSQTLLNPRSPQHSKGL